MILCLFSKNELNYVFSSYEPTGSFISYLFKNLLNSMGEVAIALVLVTIFFLVCNKFFIKLKKKKLTKILIGLLYTFIGLTAFLTACKVGFMSIGFKIGEDLSKYSDFVLITVGFIMGVLVVLAEPSVHVLVNQVEHITGGYVKKKEILISLSFGVGISLALSIIRNIYGFSIMYYLIPGYILSLALSFFIPPIYTAIAFDSGGVASGPMTSSFILPFAIGITIQKYGEAFVLNNAFGIVAMVAMTPLITIQVLGFKAIVTNKVKKEIAMRKILSSDDSQIISFM